MVIRVFFSLSFIILLSGMILVYKVPEKVSLFRSMIICYITELCFGAVVVEIFKVVGIPIGLTSLGIAFFVMGVSAWGIIIGQKKIQKVAVINWDVYTAVVILLWFSLLFLKVFSPSINNVYTNSDPAAHFQKALHVLDTGKASAMYFAEVYNAVVIELMEPFFVRLSLYKAFILADTFANLINVFMFYCLTATFIKSKFSKIILPFLSFLYFAGWPFLSYVVYGHVYFGWGVTLFAYVVYLLTKLYDSENRKNQIVLLGLVLFGIYAVLVSYLLFVVILSGVVLISLWCTARKNGFSVSRESALKIGITVVLSAAAIFSFCFWGYFRGDLSFVLRALRLEGGIAKELYQDFIYLMPGVLYMGWKYIKNKEVNISLISAGVTFLYICCTFIMCLCGIMSSYYYYKSYYVLWIFAWIVNMAFIEYLYEKDKVMLFSGGVVLLCAILITMTGFDTKLEHRGIVADEVSYEIYPSPFTIWDRMEKFIVKKTYVDDNSALIDVSQYVLKTLPESEEVPAISAHHLIGWYTTFTGNDYIYSPTDEKFVNAVQECKDAGYQYIVVYQNSDKYRDNQELLSDYDKVYDNGYFGVYMLY